LAWTGVHGADVPVGAHACADTIVDADGRVAHIFQAEGQEEKESRQEEGAAQSQGTEEAGEEEKGSEEETPPLTPFAMDTRGSVSSRRSRGHVKEKKMVRGTWCVTSLSIALACSAPREKLGDPSQEIAAMLQRSAADWNRGDLNGFMSDYARDSLTSYMAGGHVMYGWQAMYDRYQANYFAPGKSRDSLSFDELHVRVLTPDFAYATARFKLSRRDSVVASGPFTLILQRQGNRWRILHDHTSADPK
jgi:ketosteroid isomerase-like protein